LGGKSQPKKIDGERRTDKEVEKWLAAYQAKLPW
jgi:hypothetical protein